MLKKFGFILKKCQKLGFLPQIGEFFFRKSNNLTMVDKRKILKCWSRYLLKYYIDPVFNESRSRKRTLCTNFGFKRGIFLFFRRFNDIRIVRGWIIMLEKCGHPDLNVFHLKWILGTHGNWKNKNPGGRFGATSWTALPIQPIWPTLWGKWAGLAVLFSW